MYILLTDNTGKQFIVKRTDINRVTQRYGGTTCTVSFRSPKVNTAIVVNLSVSEFYNKYFEGKK